MTSYNDPNDYGTAWHGLCDLLGELTPHYTETCRKWGIDPVKHLQGLAREVTGANHKYEENQNQYKQEVLF